MLKKSALVILTSRTNPDACLTKRPLDEADFAISASPFLERPLALDTERPLQFVLTKIKNKAAQDTLVGLASSIKTGSASNFPLAGCLMHVTMNTHQGL